MLRSVAEDGSSGEVSMVSGERDFRLRLPTRWPQWARSAMLHALSLSRIALLAATDRVAVSVRLEHEVALLRE